MTTNSWKELIEQQAAESSAKLEAKVQTAVELKRFVCLSGTSKHKCRAFAAAGEIDQGLCRSHGGSQRQGERCQRRAIQED